MSPHTLSCSPELARIKWKLWHGNTTEAQDVIEDFEGDLFGLETDYPNLRKFVAAAREFGVYIASNAARAESDQPVS